MRGTYQLPPRVQLHDATLRDGEQTPGVVFSVADKVAIAEKLAEIGVERIEAGMPAVSDQDFQAIKEITRLNLPSTIFTFARAMRADIDKSLECGAHGVIVEVPIGYPKLQWQFKWTWEDVLRKSVDVVNYAKSRGLVRGLFPVRHHARARGGSDEPADAHDAGRAAGFGRHRRHDGMHSAGGDEVHGAPGEAADERCRSKRTRTTTSGWRWRPSWPRSKPGAEVVHSCANGLGERTGNAALEELIVASPRALRLRDALPARQAAGAGRAGPAG